MYELRYANLLAKCNTPKLVMFLRALIQNVLKRSDACMAVVTFSSQPLLIRNVLKKAFPNFTAKLNKIAICANTGLQCVPYFTMNQATMGKNCHLSLAMDHIVATEGRIYLLDDV